MAVSRPRTGLLLAATVTALAMTATPASANDGSPVQRVLDRAVADGGVPGIVAEIHRKHRKTWFGTAGVADRATGAKRVQGEHFRIGSVTKAFTATVMLQLAAEGRLSMDDTVAKWLPGVVEEQLGGDGSKIDLRRLLNHTSGLPDVVPGQEIPRPERPGAGFIYSKLNYNLAGMIIERVTGAKLADEIARRIARPLGLTGTYLPGGETAIRTPHARHYTKDGTGPGAQIHDVTETDVSWAWAAGGMISTTADLHRFLDSLLRGRLLPPAQQREMFTTVSTEGGDWIANTRYGLGVYAQRLRCGVTVWGGGGAVPGSWTYAMGSRRGTHRVVSNVNGDWDDPLATFTELLEARFCRTGSR
ncbi:serine hydrolase domain-containing protein [Sinosporangium siamense]|uniref:D-alanyl-D-alanine carboxypeptidase n=1 Tax=Sinosporangium siamense TaxID=1367973 RepID=A0A919RHL6_9ACTN|nr:serine hydrolase domain-containing protein [Sinosporangium siamense]GII92549.1 D-alanyl-D-alanine carboxypeptidase [Sinosporangium siamense]